MSVETFSPASYFRAILDSIKTSPRAFFRERKYLVAGRSLRLCFLNAYLKQEMTPALAMHASEVCDENSALTLYLFDSSTVNIPAPDWSSEYLPSHGMLKEYNRDGFRFAVNCDLRMLQFYDENSRQAIFWMEDAKELPYYEKAHPLRVLFHWWTAQNMRTLVHAAALGTSAGGVLLMERGGAGKSSSALSSLNSRLSCAGDDLVIVDAEAKIPRAYGLYNVAKVKSRQHAEKFFPHLLSLFELPDEQGALLLDLQKQMPQKLLRSFPVRAVICPRIEPGGRAKFIPLPKQQAFNRILPSTLELLPGKWDHVFRVLSALINKTETYELVLGADMENIPLLIEQLLREKNES